MSRKTNRTTSAQGAEAAIAKQNLISEEIASQHQEELAEEAAAAAATDATEEEEAKDEAPKVSKVIPNAKKVAFLAPLIESGEFTAKELAEKAMKQFPTLTEVTIRTFLTDSKNVKYNKFDKLVVLKEGKKMAFAEPKAA